MSDKEIFLPINEAYELANDLILFLNRYIQDLKIEIVGQLRRREETVSSIDFLVVTDKTKELIEHLETSQYLAEILESSSTNFVAKTSEGLELNFFFCEIEFYGYEKFIRTASDHFLNSFFEDHNLSRADCLGMDEKSIFASFNLPYLPASCWENYQTYKDLGTSPDHKLVTLDDIKADLHVHSTYSDGRNSIALLADRAYKLGYSYFGISDHSQSLTVARGLSVAKLKEKSRSIKKINKEYNNFTVLCGVEVDILNDGSLDYPDEVLRMADYVIGSVHVDTRMGYEQMTERVLRAVNSGKIDILGHPTGRMFGIRESLDFDIDAVMQACADKKVALEISGYTKRLDLNDRLAARAKAMGCVFACGTDAHYIDCLESMKYAVWICQRAWLDPSDIVNCRDLEGFRAFINERRELHAK